MEIEFAWNMANVVAYFTGQVRNNDKKFQFIECFYDINGPRPQIVLSSIKSGIPILSKSVLSGFIEAKLIDAGLPLLTGCTVIHGKRESGKSRFVNIISKQNNDVSQLIRFFEHEGDSWYDFDQFSTVFAAAMNDASIHIILVDSLRALLFAAGRAAGARGFNQSILSSFSVLNYLAMFYDKCLLLVINTQGGGDELDAMMNDILPSAVPNVITCLGSHFSVHYRSTKSSEKALGSSMSLDMIYYFQDDEIKDASTFMGTTVGTDHKLEDDSLFSLKYNPIDPGYNSSDRVIMNTISYK